MLEVQSKVSMIIPGLSGMLYEESREAFYMPVEERRLMRDMITNHRVIGNTVKLA